MPIEFNMPDLGENIEKGDVVSILVAIGDRVEEDQPVIELETDKAVIEVPSSASGIVQAIHVKEGESAAVGQLLLTLEGDAGQAASDHTPATAEPEPTPEPAAVEKEQPSAPAPSPAAAATTGPIEFNMPDLGENIEKGDVVSILVAIGDRVEEDQPVIELETDKAVIEVPSSASGIVQAIHVKEGESAAVGQLLLTLEGDAGQAASDHTPAIAEPEPTPEPAKKEAPTATTSSASAPAVSASDKLVPAAPSVRRLAREIGVDIAQVEGNGPGGRISLEDVKAHSKKLHETPSSSPAVAAPSLPDFSQWGEIERQPLSKVRQITAARLTQAWTSIPMVTQFDKADITDLELWRKQYGKRVESAGGKLTPTAILIKVLGAALKAFPQFNASIDLASNEVIYKKYCNIGIAVDTPHGLMVPVVRGVDEKNIIELAVELSEMAQKTRERKISPADMQGGSMTISNVGVMGGTGFTPIVNPPEVAILGVARSSVEPIYNSDGQLEPRTMMPLSLSYDHRLIDGADGARFLRWVCEALQNPFVVLLEG
jgi:pyruvate dehydrogenase E2 component (dihydrolipoamide acetyltransferase)